MEEYFGFKKVPLGAVDNTYNNYYLSRGDVVHIHGDICAEESDDRIISSVRDYEELYYKNDNEKVYLEGFERRANLICNFLKDYFKRYEILIVGYSLTESEILRFILSSKSSKNDNITVLSFKRESSDEMLLSKLYEQLGINVLFLDLDERGYNELFGFLEELANEIARKELTFSDVHELDELLNSKPRNVRRYIDFLDNNNIEYLKYALDNKLFDPEKWNNKESYKEFCSLINKFYSKANETMRNEIKRILQIIITDIKKYYDQICLDNIEPIVDLGLSRPLVKKISTQLIRPKNLKLGAHKASLFLYKLQDFSENQEAFDSAVTLLTNMLIYGTNGEVLWFRNNISNTISSLAVSNIMHYINDIKLLDKSDKDNVKWAVDEFGRLNYKIKNIEYNDIFDHFYNSIDDVLTNVNLKWGRERGTDVIRLLNIYFENNKNKEYIDKLIDSDDVLLIKSAYHFLLNYFSSDICADFIDKEESCGEIMSNLTYSKVFTELIIKSRNKLKESTKNNIYAFFKGTTLFNDKDHNSILIGCYNNLTKNGVIDNFIDLPEKFKNIGLFEGIFAGFVKSRSFITEDKIISNFEESVLELNKICQNKAEEIIDFESEKNYAGTRDEILSKIDLLKLTVSYDISTELCDEVFVDLIDAIEFPSYNFKIETLIDRIIANDIDEVELNKKMLMILDKIISSEKVNDNLWKKIYSSLNSYTIRYRSDINDVISNIKNKRFNLSMHFFNDQLFIISKILFKSAKHFKARVNDFYNFLIGKSNNLYMYSNLGFFIDVFLNNGNDVNLNKILDCDLKEQFFICGFIVRKKINLESALPLKHLFESFSFNKDIISSNKEDVLNYIGSSIYLFYGNTSIYDDFVDKIFREALDGFGDKPIKVLKGFLNCCYNDNICKKYDAVIYKINKYLFDSESKSLVYKDSLIEFIVKVVAKFSTNITNIEVMGKIVTLFDHYNDCIKIDYELYQYYQKVKDETNEKIIKITEDIKCLFKKWDSYYYDAHFDRIK